MEKKTKTTLYEDEGHLIARSQRPAPLGTPKLPQGLAAGDLLGKDTTETTVLCAKCQLPIMIVYPIRVLCDIPGRYSTEQKPAKSLGKWKCLTKPSDPCPRCKQPFARYESRNDRAEYLTSHGWV